MTYFDNPTSILPWQFNLKQLEKVFPILQQNTAQAVSIIENGQSLPVLASRTIALSGQVTTQLLPNAGNRIGLEYRILNVSKHDVEIKFKYKPNGGTTYINQSWVINPNGAFLFRWNSIQWHGFDLNDYQIINSLNGKITPTKSKILIFEIGESDDVKKSNHIFNLDDGRSHGISLELVNNTPAYVFISYNKGQYLTLPPMCPHSGSLYWNGYKWLNQTIDEWVMPSNTEALVNKYCIHKDIMNSTLHVMPKSGNKNEYYVKFNHEMVKGTIISCILDDTCSSENDINEINPHFDEYQQTGEILFCPSNISISENIASSVSLSTIINSCVINFDQSGEFIFDQSKSSSIAYLDLTKTNTDYMSIAGIHNNIDICILNSDNSDILNLYQNNINNAISDIPSGTKISIHNNSENIIIVNYYRVEERISHSLEISSGSIGTLIYWNGEFEPSKDEVITSHFISPYDGKGYLVSPINWNINTTSVQLESPMKYPNRNPLNYTIENPDKTVRFYIRAGTQFQFGSDNGKSYTFIAKNNTEIISRGIPDKDGNALDFTYFNGQRAVSTLTMIPNSGMVKNYNIANLHCNPFTNDVVGKDLYIYACAGLYGSTETGISFITSTFTPKVFPHILREICGMSAVCIIIGGFHYGMRRHTSMNYIPLCKGKDLPPSSDTVDGWNNFDISSPETITNLAMYPSAMMVQLRNMEASWLENVSIGVIPNSIWDLKDKPLCYDITNSSRQLGGMVKIRNLWVDIYNAKIDAITIGGENGHIVNDVKLSSEYGVLPTNKLTWYTLNSASKRSGKRLLKMSEWLNCIVWSPSNYSDAKYGNMNTSGTINNFINNGCGVDDNGKYDGLNGSKLFTISGYNLSDPVGNLFEIVDDSLFGLSGAGTWSFKNNTGDSNFGSSYIPFDSERMIGMGGSYITNGTLNKGIRTRDAEYSILNPAVNFGTRFCCEGTC